MLNFELLREQDPIHICLQIFLQVLGACVEHFSLGVDAFPALFILLDLGHVLIQEVLTFETVARCNLQSCVDQITFLFVLEHIVAEVSHQATS